MKTFLAAIAALALTAWATPAMAYVVEITASIDVTNIGDKAQLRHAVESAVDDIVTHAIAFTPTVVTLKNARIVGDRMYILVLIADADGEKTLQAISAKDSAASDSEDDAESSK